MPLIFDGLQPHRPGFSSVGLIVNASQFSQVFFIGISPLRLCRNEAGRHDSVTKARPIAPSLIADVSVDRRLGTGFYPETGGDVPENIRFRRPKLAPE